MRLLPLGHLTPEIRVLMPEIRDACALVDTLRRLQDHRPDGGDPTIVEAVLNRLSTLLESMRDKLTCDDDRAMLDTRLQVLRGDLLPQDPEVQRRMFTRAETTFSAYCGRLNTWSMKSDHCYWSFFASIPAPQAEAVIDKLRSALPDIDRDMVDRLGFPVQLSAPPLYVIHDLIACAGESARFPKHFAYFLPEDEGVEGTHYNKTIVFRNVYAHRFEAASEMLVERYFPQLAAVPVRPTTSADAALPIWMYGHDVGHMSTLGRVGRVPAPGLGKFGSASLDELKADLVSVAAMATPSWQKLTDIQLEEGLRFYVAEMLRYLTRDRHQFFDSASAFMQVTFLVEHGWLDIEENRLVADVESVATGLTYMLKDLQQMAQGGSKELRTLLRHYLIDGPGVAPVARLTEAMMQSSRDIPRYTSYV